MGGVVVAILVVVVVVKSGVDVSGCWNFTSVKYRKVTFKFGRGSEKLFEKISPSWTKIACCVFGNDLYVCWNIVSILRSDLHCFRHFRNIYTKSYRSGQKMRAAVLTMIYLFAGTSCRSCTVICNVFVTARKSMILHAAFLAMIYTSAGTSCRHCAAICDVFLRG